jgi:uncharacterized protein (TIGR01777 family)
MKIVLSGATGFLGRPLSSALTALGHEVVILTRGPGGRDAISRRVHWDPDGSAGGPWAAEMASADAIVNLAGENIAGGRWTDRRKDALRESRILATRSLVDAVRRTDRRPKIFLNGSAVGFYGDTADTIVDESSPPGSDFLATLCVDWEAEAHAVEALGARVVLVRTGIVLAAGGGALGKLLPPFRLFVGGRMGSGRQYMSWIHRDDWIGLVAWAIANATLAGALNATAPTPVTNEEFSQALGAAMGRPAWLPAPGVALKALLGEMASVALLAGQRVIPKRAMDGGYAFKYPTLPGALTSALAPPTG